MGKTVILEGKYDSATGRVVRDIIKVIKKTKGYPDDSMVSIDLPHDLTGEDEYEMSKAEITFNVEVNIKRSNTEMEFKIESFKVKEEDTLQFNMIINPEKEPEVYRAMYNKLQEDVRHEMEHILQDWGRGDRPAPSDEDHEGETTYEHHKRLEEVPAMVQGYYRRAKMERRPLDEIMTDDLDNEIEQGNLTTQEAEDLLRIWMTYAKRRLPKAIYTND
jgi:hypothetical protein